MKKILILIIKRFCIFFFLFSSLIILSDFDLKGLIGCLYLILWWMYMTCKSYLFKHKLLTDRTYSFEDVDFIEEYNKFTIENKFHKLILKTGAIKPYLSKKINEKKYEWIIAIEYKNLLGFLFFMLLLDDAFIIPKDRNSIVFYNKLPDNLYML